MSNTLIARTSSRSRMRSSIYLRVMRMLRPVVFPLLCLASFVFLGDATHAQTNNADYDAFKEKVQPIFLKSRSTHGRCVTCHGGGNGGGFVLQPLSPGAATWDEEQTRKNYLEVSQLV